MTGTILEVINTTCCGSLTSKLHKVAKAVNWSEETRLKFSWHSVPNCIKSFSSHKDCFSELCDWPCPPVSHPAWPLTEGLLCSLSKKMLIQHIPSMFTYRGEKGMVVRENSVWENHNDIIALACCLHCVSVSQGPQTPPGSDYSLTVRSLVERLWKDCSVVVRNANKDWVWVLTRLRDWPLRRVVGWWRTTHTQKLPFFLSVYFIPR